MKDILKYSHFLVYTFGIVILLLGSISSSYGQYTSKDDYLKSKIEYREVDNSAWTDASGELDYSPKPKKKKKKRRERQNSERDNNRNSGRSGPLFSGDGGAFLKAFSFVVLILLLSFLVFKIIGGQTFVSNKKIDPNQRKVFDIRDVEANIHETELELYLKEASSAGDYKMAIRIYYLMIIKELSSLKLINWKKDKTNSEYINEVRKTQFFKSFRKVTRLFDYVWYSDATIDEEAYKALEPDFKEFLADIGKK